MAFFLRKNLIGESVGTLESLGEEVQNRGEPALCSLGALSQQTERTNAKKRRGKREKSKLERKGGLSAFVNSEKQGEKTRSGPDRLARSGVKTDEGGVLASLKNLSIGEPRKATSLSKVATIKNERKNGLTSMFSANGQWDASKSRHLQQQKTITSTSNTSSKAEISRPMSLMDFARSSSKETCKKIGDGSKGEKSRSMLEKTVLQVNASRHRKRGKDVNNDSPLASKRTDRKNTPAKVSSTIKSVVLGNFRGSHEELSLPSDSDECGESLLGKEMGADRDSIPQQIEIIQIVTAEEQKEDESCASTVPAVFYNWESWNEIAIDQSIVEEDPVLPNEDRVPNEVLAPPLAERPSGDVLDTTRKPNTAMKQTYEENFESEPTGVQAVEKGGVVTKRQQSKPVGTKNDKQKKQRKNRTKPLKAQRTKSAEGGAVTVSLESKTSDDTAMKELPTNPNSLELRATRKSTRSKRETKRYGSYDETVANDNGSGDESIVKKEIEKTDSDDGGARKVDNFSTDTWSHQDLFRLKKAYDTVDPKISLFWTEVAALVEGKTPEDCRKQWFSLIRTPLPKTLSKGAINNRTGDGDFLSLGASDDDIFESTPMRMVDMTPFTIAQRNSALDLGSAIVLKEEANATSIGEDSPEFQAKVGYKSYIQAMKRDIRKEGDGKGRKGVSKKQNRLGKAISETFASADVDLNVRLTPGGTLKVKSNADEDDFWEEMSCEEPF